MRRALRIQMVQLQRRVQISMSVMIKGFSIRIRQNDLCSSIRIRWMTLKKKDTSLPITLESQPL